VSVSAIFNSRRDLLRDVLLRQTVWFNLDVADELLFDEWEGFHNSIPSQTWASTSRGERMRSGRSACQAAKAMTQTAA
jgi:hypothetical protein